MKRNYKIIRFYEEQGLAYRVLRSNLTEREAIELVRDPERSSLTCKLWHNRKRTDLIGHWFDGFTSSPDYKASFGNR